MQSNCTASLASSRRSLPISPICLHRPPLHKRMASANQRLPPRPSPSYPLRMTGSSQEKQGTRLQALRKVTAPSFPSGSVGGEGVEVAAMATREVEAARGVDLRRYLGRWYQIASLPSRVEPRDGRDTRATYALNPDGTVGVLNETWSGGRRASIEGTALRADPDSDEAKLRVKFYVPPFLPVIPSVGDSWVLHIDTDYQHALVGHPSRRYLWILCRQNHMDEEVYNRLVEKAREVGYDVSKLHRTSHSETPPEAEQAPKDKGIWWIKSLLLGK